MHGRLAAVVAAVVTAGLSSWSPPAGAAVLFDQSGVDPANVRNISTAVVADDFALATGATLRSIQAFLVDSAPNNNGVLDAFGGTLSWGLYDNGFEAPNVGVPETLIDSGSATGADLVLTDTGLQDSLGGDIIRAHFNLTPNQALLADAVYWLALHEGPWLSAADDTPVGWVGSTGLSGSQSVRDPIETMPGSDWQPNGYDLAFAGFNTPVPEPSAAAAAAAGLAAAGLTRRRVWRGV